MKLPRQLHYTPEQIYKGARLRVLRVRDRDPNAYATHMPVLAALAKVHPIRSVLELGSGPFSTSLFLNRNVFPELERLVSYEDDAEWATTVTAAAGDDPRLDFRVVQAVPPAVPAADVPGFDLIFIDDSQTEVDRAQTARNVAAAGPRGAVAIHDYEAAPYRAAGRAFDNHLTVKTFTPQVGVCWMNAGAIERAQILHAQQRVEAGVGIDVADVDAWQRHLS